MKRGTSEKTAYPSQCVDLFLAVMGAGAAAPTVATDAQYPVKHNAVSRLAAEIPTRSGVGVYTVTLGADFQVPARMALSGYVEGADAQVCGLTYVAATRVLTVKVFTPAGVALELANGTALLIIRLDGRNSLA